MGVRARRSRPAVIAPPPASVASTAALVAQAAVCADAGCAAEVLRAREWERGAAIVGAPGARALCSVRVGPAPGERERHLAREVTAAACE